MINPDWLNNGEDSRTLTQAGAATRVKLNLEDDTDYTGPGEMDDTRVYNKANELQTRDTDSNASVNYTLSHDAVGNMTDDGQANEYIYDVWGRVRFVNNQTPLPVSEYRYNGLNWRISVSHDTDSDDDIDASDVIWHFIHDERWRIVAVYRENDADPKEQFVYHSAGQNGMGTASYIDDVILRDKDASDDWENAADATLEQRYYYCQNWRHDVIALIDSAGGGTQVEQQRYEAYGVPYLFVAGDMTANGGINATDLTEIQALIDLPGYDVRADLDLDGDVDATDKSIATANSSKGAGREKLTNHTGNRKGYAGYEYDDSIVHVSYHVRHRVLDSTLGQWMGRYLLGYRSSSNSYSYASTRPFPNDPDGNPLPTHPNPGPGYLPEPQAPPTRRTDQQCCDDAEAAGLRQRGLLPGELYDAGGVICCDGRKIACAWFPHLIEDDPEGIDSDAFNYIYNLIRQCVIQHEEVHFNHVPDCPWPAPRKLNQSL